MYCGNCGKSFKEDNKFCPHCGAVNDFFDVEEKTAEKEIKPTAETAVDIEQPKKKKVWKKVIVAVVSVILVAFIGVAAYFAACFFTEKPYRIKYDEDGAHTEYYFGSSFTDLKEIYYNEKNLISSVYTRERKHIDSESHLIETTVAYYYDENKNIIQQQGIINGEPGVYEHKFIIDENGNYTSDEKWFLGEDEHEYIIQDSIQKTEYKRYYEVYDTDDLDYLNNAHPRLCILAWGGRRTDGSDSYGGLRLIKEEYTDLEDADNNTTSVIHYYDDEIVEEETDSDGWIYITKYDLTGEVIDSYWADD